jgi:hypothetical protein
LDAEWKTKRMAVELPSFIVCVFFPDFQRGAENRALLGNFNLLISVISKIVVPIAGIVTAVVVTSGGIAAVESRRILISIGIVGRGIDHPRRIAELA